MIGEEDQNLHLLATIGHQAIIWGIGARALTQPPTRTRNRRPARIAFVVAGNHRLTHTRHALYRLHAGHGANLEVEGFHRTHDLWRQAGLVDILRPDEHRQDIEADGVAADYFTVVLVIARVGAQFRRASTDITNLELTRLGHPETQQQQADGEHRQRRTRFSQGRQPPP